MVFNCSFIDGIEFYIWQISLVIRKEGCEIVRFVSVSRCGRISIEDIRKKDMIERYKQNAREGKTIINSIVGGVFSAQCMGCPHRKIKTLDKPFNGYRTASECQSIVIKDGGNMPSDWVTGVIKDRPEVQP